MWILIGLVVIAAVLVVVFRIVKPWDDGLWIFGFSILAFSLFSMAISIPLNRIDVRSKIAQHDALQSTYTRLRSRPLEMTTAANKIAEWNAWLATAKYWDSTQFDWWCPDDVKTLKPIE